MIPPEVIAVLAGSKCKISNSPPSGFPFPVEYTDEDYNCTEAYEILGIGHIVCLAAGSSNKFTGDRLGIQDGLEHFSSNTEVGCATKYKKKVIIGSCKEKEVRLEITDSGPRCEYIITSERRELIFAHVYLVIHPDSLPDLLTWYYGVNHLLDF